MYFLSLGPAVVAYENTNSTQIHAAIRTVYHPVELLYEEFPSTQPVIDGYVDLWN